MRVLFIESTGGLGGIQRYVHCLARCLSDCGVEVKTLIIGEAGPVGETMRADGLDVVALGCRNAHQLRIISALHRIVREWKPDVIAPQMPMLMPMLYFNLYDRNIPLVRSIHTPAELESRLVRCVTNLLGRRYDLFLPVSRAAWEKYVSVYPWARNRGEVFFNSLRLGSSSSRESHDGFRVGMIGRKDMIKGWDCFAAVAARGGAKFVAAGMTGSDAVELLGGGAVGSDCIDWQGPQSDGRSWIASIDLFVMASVTELLPTVLLECFAEGTPVCGFIPDGGVSEILELSEGPLREVFIPRRDPDELSKVVIRLAGDADLRNRIVIDGRNVLERYFDANRNCRGQLLDAYRRVIAAKGRSSRI